MATSKKVKDPKPVKAWCVCFTNGMIDVQDIRLTKRDAEARRDWLQGGLPPLSIIPVLVTPIPAAGRRKK